MRSAPQLGRRFLVFAKFAIVIIAFTLLGFFDGTIARGIAVYEDAAYALDPSISRAELYAERHFDARHPIMYDVERAEHFYREVEKFDTKHLYLYHQLSRIEFLRGNFHTAMVYINRQIKLHGEAVPYSYYVRGLTEGYMGLYDEAARDYGYFLKVEPHNWAAATDYSWVLLKAGRAQEAADITKNALKDHPGNAWLLATRAIALYEIGDLEEALRIAKIARFASSKITEAQWLTAYPGNDPRIARQGVATHQKSIEENIHKIEAAIEKNALQSR
jgi:tetratricopeptide (TPR) repeat protein